MSTRDGRVCGHVSESLVILADCDNNEPQQVHEWECVDDPKHRPQRNSAKRQGIVVERDDPQPECRLPDLRAGQPFGEQIVGQRQGEEERRWQPARRFRRIFRRDIR